MNAKMGETARILVLGTMFCAYPVIGFSQQAPAADNTKSNDNPSETTADRQSNAPSDRELTQSVQKAIMVDKALSTYAHNVKVVAQNGQVTLSGPVRSDDEKQAIVAKAAEVVGKDKVVDMLRGAYTEGRLSLEEFGERTTAAYAAKTWSALRELTADLPAGAVLIFLRCWVRLYGMVSLEVFGHLHFALGDAASMFEITLSELAGLVGLDYPLPR